MTGNLMSASNGLELAATTIHHYAHRFLRDVSTSAESTLSNIDEIRNSSTSMLNSTNEYTSDMESNGTLVFDGGSEEDSSFDPKVFWSVNAFILVLFCSALGICCFGKKEWFSFDGEFARQQSDETYRQSVLQRRRQQQEAKTDTPAQRTRKLLRSFRRHRVEMVRWFVRLRFFSLALSLR